MSEPGKRYAIVTLFVRQVLGLACGVALARLLEPSAFGVVAMMTSVSSVLMLAADLGLTWGLVQRRNLSIRQAREAFWLLAATGVAALTVCAASGPVVAGYFRAPELVIVAPVSGLGILLVNLSIVPLTLLRRRMAQRSLSGLYLVSTLAAQAAAIGMALLGAGYWSLVVQAILPNLVTLVVAFSASGFHPGTPRLTRAVLLLASVGVVLAVANVLGSMQSGVEAFVIGRIGTTSDVGALSRAQFLRSLPLLYLVVGIGDVMIPALSASRDDRHRVARLYHGANFRVARLACPMAAALGVFAPEVVQLLLGAQWAESVPLLRWMSIACAALPLSGTAVWLLLSFRRGGVLVALAAMNLGVTLLAALGGSAFGSVGVVVATSFATAVVIAPVTLVLAHRVTGISVHATMRVIAPGLAVGVIIALYGVAGSWVAHAIGLAGVAASVMKFGFVAVGFYPVLRQFGACRTCIISAARK